MELPKVNKLRFKSLGLDSRNEHIIIMRADCQVCISEGFEALTRVQVKGNGKSIVATMNVLKSDLLEQGEASLSERAVEKLGLKDGDILTVSHLTAFDSLSHVRAKIYGQSFSAEELKSVVTDIVAGHYSIAHLSAFITACAGNRLSINEIIYLTRAMIETGDSIDWGGGVIVDKHCIGGLPGNRTTPVVVSIAAALGLRIPKTSSRAITSPAGTADTMEVLTNVNLSLDQMQDVVRRHNACIAWGGSANLSPADDILIRVEKAIDIDSEGQMIASVLSKKATAGSTHVIIDFPVGETVKLRTLRAAEELKTQMEVVGREIGLKIKVVITDGSQPVGRGIGPALEAMDVLAVLRNEKHAPADLRDRSVLLAGELLELAGKAKAGDGAAMAAEVLSSGAAWQKFQDICNAQGGLTEPSFALYKKEILSESDGTVTKINNRRLARVAKLAGAPQDPRAGVLFNSPLGKKVKKGDILYTIYAESLGELNYAIEYLKRQNTVVEIG